MAPAATVSGGENNFDAPLVTNTFSRIIDGNIPAGLSTGGAQNVPRSPFGNESGLPAADTSHIQLTDTFEFVTNPGMYGGFVDGDFDGVPDVPVGNVVRASSDGGFRVDTLGQQFQDVVLDGTIPQSGGPPAATMQDFFAQMGLDPNATGVQDLNGISVRVIRSPDALGDIPLDNQPVLVSGGVVAGNLPLGDDCGGNFIDLGRLDGLAGGFFFEPADFAPEDLFGGGSQAIVGRCAGSGWVVDRMVNTGGSFSSVDTGTHMIIGENAWIAVTPIREVANTIGSRQFSFTTPQSNPFTPDSTAYTSNMLPGLREGTTPVLVFDPHSTEQRLGVFPIQVQFSGGDFESGAPCPNTYTQLFEAHVMPGGDGMYPTTLHSFASGQMSMGTLTINGSTTLVAEGMGEGYTETYDFDGATGTYHYMPGTFDCEYHVSLGEGYEQLMASSIFDEPEPVVEPDPPVLIDDPPAVIDDSPVAVIDDPIVDPGGDPATDLLDDQGVISDNPVVIIDPVDSSGGGGGGPNWPLVALGTVALAGGATMYTRHRRMGPDDIVARQPEQIDEPSSVAITEEDLARYAEFGIDDHAVAQQATATRTATDTAITRGQSAEEVAQAAIDAEIASAKDVELAPMPVMPDMRNIQLTDNPLLAFGFEFVTVMENDLTTGRSEERIAEFIVAMPGALEKAGTNVVQQVGTAWTGWGEIFHNPESLLELDDAVVDAGGGFVEMGGHYLEEAEKDSDEFVQMTADITANIQVQAVIGKGLQVGGAALANRLQGTVAATETAAATGTTTAGARTGTAPTVRPPTTRTGTGSTQVGRPPQAGPPAAAPPTPPANPVGPLRVPTQAGGGTPIQLAPNGCGAAVFRGIMRDLGLAVPREIEVLIAGATQRLGGFRLWNPNGGFNLAGMVQTMRGMLPATVRVFQQSFRGLANKVDIMAKVLADTPGVKLMVGVRWKGAFNGGAGHWLRVEAVQNGWVALGDPATGFTIAVRASQLESLAECAIAVVP